MRSGPRHCRWGWTSLPWWPSMGQCFPDRQREQFPFDGRSTDFRRRPYFRLGIAMVPKRRSSKITADLALFEPRHVLNRTRDVDRVSSSSFVFRGLQTGGGRFGLLDNLLGDLLTCSDRFLRGGFGGFCGFFALRLGFFSACSLPWRPMKPFLQPPLKAQLSGGHRGLLSQVWQRFPISLPSISSPSLRQHRATM